MEILGAATLPASVGGEGLGPLRLAPPHPMLPLPGPSPRPLCLAPPPQRQPRAPPSPWLTWTLALSGQ